LCRPPRSNSPSDVPLFRRKRNFLSLSQPPPLREQDPAIPSDPFRPLLYRDLAFLVRLFFSRSWYCSRGRRSFLAVFSSFFPFLYTAGCSADRVGDLRFLSAARFAHRSFPLLLDFPPCYKKSARSVSAPASVGAASDS